MTEAPSDPSDLLFYVNRWRAIPAAYPLRVVIPWSPCNGPLAARAHPESDLICLPRKASHLSPEALRQIAWDAPAPADRPQTHDGLPVGYQGRVGFGPLLAAALEQGHELRIRSGFRSFVSQGVVFRSWVRQQQIKGFAPEEAQRRAEASSAHPGHSEHQLGTTADLVYRDASGDVYDGWDPERIAASAPMRWVAANAHRFGLVLSYERDASPVTQYVWEPWHYRYVGVEAADEVHRCRIPLEAFLNTRYQAGPQPAYALP